MEKDIKISVLSNKSFTDLTSLITITLILVKSTGNISRGRSDEIQDKKNIVSFAKRPVSDNQIIRVYCL